MDYEKLHQIVIKIFNFLIFLFLFFPISEQFDEYSVTVTDIQLVLDNSGKNTHIIDL